MPCVFIVCLFTPCYFYSGGFWRRVRSCRGTPRGAWGLGFWGCGLPWLGGLVFLLCLVGAVAQVLRVAGGVGLLPLLVRCVAGSRGTGWGSRFALLYIGGCGGIGSREDTAVLIPLLSLSILWGYWGRGKWWLGINTILTIYIWCGW